MVTLQELNTGNDPNGHQYQIYKIFFWSLHIIKYQVNEHEVDLYVLRCNAALLSKTIHAQNHIHGITPRVKTDKQRHI